MYFLILFLFIFVLFILFWRSAWRRFGWENKYLFCLFYLLKFEASEKINKINKTNKINKIKKINMFFKIYFLRSSKILKIK